MVRAVAGSPPWGLGMRRFIRWFWIVVALVFLFEAWLWDHLEPIAAAIVAQLPLDQAKKRIANWVERLSPTVSLLVFAVPVGLLLPFKLAALWLLARGYWTGAVSALVSAKIVGFGSTAFVFDATRDKLLQLNWFRALYNRLIVWRAWSHALIDPVVQGIKKNLALFRKSLALFAPHGVGGGARLMSRIRRRVRAPTLSTKALAGSLRGRNGEQIP